MGTVLVTLGGYYLLSGKAFKAASEAAKWIDDKVNQPKDGKQNSCLPLNFYSFEIQGNAIR